MRWVSFVTGQGGIKHEHDTEMGVRGQRELSALRQEILKSHIVAERARGIETQPSAMPPGRPKRFERLEKMLGTSSDLDQTNFEYLRAFSQKRNPLFSFIEKISNFYVMCSVRTSSQPLCYKTQPWRFHRASTYSRKPCVADANSMDSPGISFNVDRLAILDSTGFRTGTEPPVPTS